MTSKYDPMMVVSTWYPSCHWKTRVLFRSWKSLRLPTNFRDTFNLLDTSMVWKFVGSQLPTFWTLPWYGNLLEVNLQPFGHFHGMEICWKSTSNLSDTSMVWNCWKSTSDLLDTSMVWRVFGNLLEVSWKFIGSRNFHDLERTRFSQF